jgi:hypothetical protein
MSFRSIALNLFIIVSAYQATVFIFLPFYYLVLLVIVLCALKALVCSNINLPNASSFQRSRLIDDTVILLFAIAGTGIISPLLSLSGVALMMTDPLDASGRFGLMLLQIIILCSISNIYKKLPLALLIKESRMSFFILSALVAMIFVDFFFNNILGIDFNLGGRSDIHGSLRAAADISSRPCGFFREPAYAVPTLLMWVWLLILNTKRLVASFAIYLSAAFITFSLGNYLVPLLGLLFFFRLSFTSFLSKSFLRYLVLSLSISLIAIAFVPFVSQWAATSYQLVFVRIFEYDSFGGIDANIRFGLPLYLVGQWLDSSNLFNILFGFGHQSVFYLGKSALNNSGFEYGTSNNLISDSIYEVGAIGLMLYAILFIILAVRALRLWHCFTHLSKARFDSHSRKFLVPVLFASNFILFGLAASSMLNASWSSPSFYALLFFFLMGYHHCRCYLVMSLQA